MSIMEVVGLVVVLGGAFEVRWSVADMVVVVCILGKTGGEGRWVFDLGGTFDSLTC